jgi:hypothetical protein
MKKIGSGKPGVSVFNANVVNNIENEKVFQGVAFSIAKRFDLVGGATANILIDLTGITTGRVVFFPVKFKAFGAGPVNIDLYRDPVSADDGTIWEYMNRDDNSANLSKTVVRFNPTVSDPGDKTPVEFAVFSDGVAAVAVAGGESKDNLVFNAVIGKKYLFKVTNIEAGADAFVHYASDYFEIEQ